MIILSKEQIILLHEQLIESTGGEHGILNEGLLESSIYAPFQSFGGEDIYPTIYQKAARLCYGLVMNHAFVDGNKRIGVHAMLVFLSLNQINLTYSQKELYEIILDIASGAKDSEKLLEWILNHQT